ncbi:hypothetical protein B0T17DRAFT_598460 [Bombardia bombarda]|uniref:Uncharacterized protein n=1 Tax=Bombardia bombarda TaxID=252184 RepID=A0AA39XA91_9PEZI|nr:hypothetical protein B0T17DRAFT_598460 [Bombardia bombarda]
MADRQTFLSSTRRLRLRRVLGCCLVCVRITPYIDQAQMGPNSASGTDHLQPTSSDQLRHGTEYIIRWRGLQEELQEAVVDGGVGFGEMVMAHAHLGPDGRIDFVDALRRIHEILGNDDGGAPRHVAFDYVVSNEGPISSARDRGHGENDNRLGEPMWRQRQQRRRSQQRRQRHQRRQI